MKRGRVAIVLAAAGACFAAGIWLGRAGRPGPAAAAAPGVEIVDGGAPKLVFDPSSVKLLPDASLQLAPIVGFDAGASDGD
ncbi:MAG TPA: hypothetical protein VHB21_11525 [Minicystis sp.]|nr:hypothetical protein [Minicystis sp.]